jgi:hypothetical protein
MRDKKQETIKYENTQLKDFSPSSSYDALAILG